MVTSNLLASQPNPRELGATKLIERLSRSMGGPFDTYLLEADAITGPYRMITYMPVRPHQAPRWPGRALSLLPWEVAGPLDTHHSWPVLRGVFGDTEARNIFTFCRRYPILPYLVGISLFSPHAAPRPAAQAFGPAAYFANIPSKFVANATTTDAEGNAVLACYLSYSQWGQLPGLPTGRSDPPGSSYKWDMLPIRLVLNRDATAASVLRLE
jgi:hypothetical protein